MLIVVVHRIVPETVALKQEAIPHTAIPDSTNHFSFVNTLWESEFDLACSVEGFQVFGGELEIQTGEIVLELRYLARSNEWDYWHRLIAQPDERYLGHAAADLRGDRLHRRDDPRRALFLGKELFHSLIGHPRAVGLTLTVILSCEHATR